MKEIPCPLPNPEIILIRHELLRLISDSDTHPANVNAASQLYNFYGAVLDSRMANKCECEEKP